MAAPGPLTNDASLQNKLKVVECKAKVAGPSWNPPAASKAKKIKINSASDTPHLLLFIHENANVFTDKR